MAENYIAIYNKTLIAEGNLAAIVRQVKSIEPPQAAKLPVKRGRPKLGVQSKEVTLLPKHWEWLTSQRGGASVTLRRLIDQAIKNVTPEQVIQMKQNQLYNLLNLFADDAGFEEATRALYRNNKANFMQAIATWPKDLQQLIQEKFVAIHQLHSGKNNDNGPA
ncbi:DUF2239 family protein [Aliikangiella maris]|uniref:DUF2239 family protein n=2 Tax=Aliikangiella maris TaxID=3162458 RepID=A0ABV2BRP1_9GAMM